VLESSLSKIIMTSARCRTPAAAVGSMTYALRALYDLCNSFLLMESIK
jgi:hypothetical protein